MTDQQDIVKSLRDPDLRQGKYLVDDAANEIVRLRKVNDDLHTEIERLLAALQEIVDEAASHNGITPWEGADVARAALNPKDTKDD